jgi:soluble lytic murein transglycosylase
VLAGLLFWGSGRLSPVVKGAGAAHRATLPSANAEKAAHSAAAKKPSPPRSRKTSAKETRNIAPPRRFTLAGSGLEPTHNPLLADPVMGELRSISRPFLESPTPPRRRELEQFAARQPAHQAGALAYLALGYSAIEEKRFAEAATYLKSGRAIRSQVPDYLDYYLASSLQSTGRHREALEVLDGFEQRYPSSSLGGRAVLARAESWMATGQASSAAGSLKSRLGALESPEADLLLGRAHEAAGDPPAAAEAYRRAYYLYPNSDQADDAEQALSRLARQPGKAIPPASIEMRRQRAELLQSARQYRRAADAYRELAAATGGAERERAQVAAAAATFQAGMVSRAYTTLAALRLSDAAADAQRLYYLGEYQRRMSRLAAYLETVRRLGELYPNSPWYEDALFSAGNYYLRKRSPDDYARYYRMLYERFPAGKNAALAHWRVAWKHYRAGEHETARRLFQEQATRYPDNPLVAGALYWLGRLAEKRSPALAQTYWHKTAQHFPQYFYGTLARQRLTSAPAAPDPPPPPEVAAVLAAIPEYHPSLLKAPRPADFGEHRRKVQTLELTGLLDLAVLELRHSTNDPTHSRYLTLELARLERDRGRFRTAIEYIRRVYPNYFAFPFNELDRKTWELLFPLPWWPTVQTNALRAGLDPYLVMALIRQESAFNPWAISSARAYGLMQLLPATARQLSPRAGTKRRPNTSILFDPVTNIQLGTRYFTEMLAHFGGRLEPALAGYNAGPERVDLWLAAENTDDPAQFVESIPFTETRDYVQAVVRNAAIYRRLYASK